VKLTEQQVSRMSDVCAEMRAYGFTTATFSHALTDDGLELSIRGKKGGQPYELSCVVSKAEHIAPVLAQLAAAAAQEGPLSQQRRKNILNGKRLF
jgi:hypothetical protein